ncbi:MAG TPA: Yip1 family protein [Candidatus Methylomirabilis sp.]|nr:Yip1 family protein [Candidatus Methylomirabilis sp.]
MNPHTMIERMKGAALLDIQTYEEVEADSTATGQAAGVVALVAVAQAIGGSSQGAPGMLTGLLIAFVGWLIWSGVTYLIGDKILGGTATWGELLRTLGFAQTPGLLAFLGVIPGLGGLIRFVLSIWVLVAGIIAIRQALDFSTGKAVLTAVLGWLAIAIPLALLAMGGAGMPH